MSKKPPIDQEEMAELERLGGPFPCQRLTLKLSAASRRHWGPLLASDRRAEVVLLLPRPGDRLVTIAKPTYPDGVVRLPTGGIGMDEAVLDAAARETLEETGLVLSPKRVVGAIDWTYLYRRERRRFASYLCLFPASDQPLVPVDSGEEISRFEMLPADQLGAVATQLASLPAPWQSWGRQRGAPHKLAHHLLSLAWNGTDFSLLEL